MEIPSQRFDLQKATNELKPGPNKVLIKVLIYGILAVAGALAIVYKLNNSNSDGRLAYCQEINKQKDEEIRQLKRKADSLTNYILVEAQNDIRWFKQRDAKMDSIVNKYKYLIINQ